MNLLKEYKALPETFVRAMDYFIEENPQHQELTYSILETFLGIQLRFNSWRKHRLSDLAFELRKANREFDPTTANISLADEKEILETKYRDMISEREQELQLLYLGYETLITLVADKTDVVERLKLLLLNLKGPTTVKIRTMKSKQQGNA